MTSILSHLQAENEDDRLERSLADAQTDLQRHGTALSKLQGELAASRLEVCGARGETVQFAGFLRLAQAQTAAAHVHIEELRLHAAEREAEIVRLHMQIESLHSGMSDLRERIDAIYTSLSWRVSAPVRIASRLLRRR